jgi:ABC-type uncharacterized transport system ATPase subunit
LPAPSSTTTTSEPNAITRMVFEAEPQHWPDLIDHYNRHSRILHFSEKLPSFQDIFIQAVGTDNLGDADNSATNAIPSANTTHIFR